MSRADARKAAESLMDHLRLSDAQAAVLLDQTASEPTLRVYVFDSALVASRRWPKHWLGFAVEIVPSAPFRPFADTLT